MVSGIIGNIIRYSVYFVNMNSAFIKMTSAISDFQAKPQCSSFKLVFRLCWLPVQDTEIKLMFSG